MHPRLTAAVGIIAIGISVVLWQAVPTSQQTGWQITDLDIGPTESPDIAIDADGNALAVWWNAQQIRSATFSSATGTWGPPLALSNSADFNGAPRVRTNAAGDAVAVWRIVKFSNATTSIAVARYSAATRSWGSALELATRGNGPQAVIDAHGNVTVIWLEFLRNEGEYYYDDVHQVRAVRYDATTASWSAPVNLSDDYAFDAQLGIDGAGNVTAMWSRLGFIEAARLPSGGNGWSVVTQVSAHGAGGGEMAVDAEGNAILVWSMVGGGLYGARFSIDSETWSPPVLVADGAFAPRLGVDAAGDATLAYTVHPLVSGRATLRSKSYLRATDSWSAATDITTSAGCCGEAELAVDPFGNATIGWLGPEGELYVARRPAGGVWSTLGAIAGPNRAPRVASDAGGNIFMLWGRAFPLDPPTLKAARLAATLSAPSIAHVTSRSGSLTIDFKPPQVTESTFAALNYEYSLDDGDTWTARTPASPASPIVVDGLTNGIAYPVRLRAINVAGRGQPSDAALLTPGLAVPTNLRAANVLGNLVTLAWTPPASGPPPTGYVVEGGLTPGTVLGRLTGAGTATVFSFAAPSGVFYVRVRATIGPAESEPSNEILIAVGGSTAPYAPTNLLGLADGDSLTLVWRNTGAGGTPTGIVLDVSGDLFASIPLQLTEQFSFSTVPAGTYTLAVRAVNAVGSSNASNAVTLTFPGACSPPSTPGNLTVSKSGNTIVALWSPPPTGAAPTGYVLSVSGALNGSFPITGLTLSGPVAPGAYTIAVAATNRCGVSAPTPPQTVTIQ